MTVKILFNKDYDLSNFDFAINKHTKMISTLVIGKYKMYQTEIHFILKFKKHFNGKLHDYYRLGYDIIHISNDALDEIKDSEKEFYSNSSISENRWIKSLIPLNHKFKISSIIDLWENLTMEQIIKLIIEHHFKNVELSEIFDFYLSD